MNNAIFFLIIVAYVCLSVARFYSRNFPVDHHNFYNFLFPNLQDPNSGNTPYLDRRLPLTAYIQWFYITFYSIEITMKQSGQFKSSRSHVATNHVVTNKLLKLILRQSFRERLENYCPNGIWTLHFIHLPRLVEYSEQIYGLENLIKLKPRLNKWNF